MAQSRNLNRVSVYKVNQSPETAQPFRSLSHEKANKLCAKNLAVRISEKAIRLRYSLGSFQNIKARNPEFMPALQAKFVHGGLTRTDHNPKHSHGSK